MTHGAVLRTLPVAPVDKPSFVTHTVSLRDDHSEAITALARKQGRKFSHVLRDIIEMWLAS